MFATLHCCFVAFLLFLNCYSSKNGVVNVFKNRMDWNGTERKGLQTHQAKNGNEIRKKKWTHKICIKLSFEHFFCFLFAVLLFLLSLLLLLVFFLRCFMSNASEVCAKLFIFFGNFICIVRIVDPFHSFIEFFRTKQNTHSLNIFYVSLWLPIHCHLYLYCFSDESNEYE